jgi:hypothetical protein
MTFGIIVILCCVSYIMLFIPILALESRPCYRIDGSFNEYRYKGFKFPATLTKKLVTTASAGIYVLTTDYAWVPGLL